MYLHTHRRGSIALLPFPPRRGSVTIYNMDEGDAETSLPSFLPAHVSCLVIGFVWKLFKFDQRMRLTRTDARVCVCVCVSYNFWTMQRDVSSPCLETTSSQIRVLLLLLDQNWRRLDCYWRGRGLFVRKFRMEEVFVIIEYFGENFEDESFIERWNLGLR